MDRPIWQRLLGPLAPDSHLGIHVEDDIVHAAAVVPSIAGPRECDELAFPLSGRSPAQVVAEIISKTRAKVGKLRSVVLGVAPRDVYLEARRSTPAIVPGAVRGLEPVSGLKAVDGAARPIVQMIRQPDPHGGAGQSLQMVVAARDSVLERHEALFPTGDEIIYNLEPVAVAALRYSFSQAPVRSYTAVTIRVLAGPRFFVAFLLHGATPLMCLPAPTHEPAERPQHLQRMVMGLVHHARSYLELEVTEVLVEGMDERVVKEQGRALEMPVRALSPQAVDGRAIALGLALGACGVAPGAIHLYRQQRERRRVVRPAFPWRDLAAGVAALILVLLGTAVQGRRLQATTAGWRALAQPDASQAKRTLEQLKTDRETLEKFQNQWVDFADRPISWTRVLTSLATALPDGVKLMRIEGHSQPLGPRKPGEPREYSFQVTSPEKHLTLGAVLADQYLKRAFPRVEVGMQVSKTAASGYSYTLMATGSAAVSDTERAAPAKGAP